MERGTRLRQPGDEPALRAVFEYFGFEVIEQRVFDVRGVEMRNAAMRKVLR